MNNEDFFLKSFDNKNLLVELDSSSERIKE